MSDSPGLLITIGANGPSENPPINQRNGQILEGGVYPGSHVLFLVNNTPPTFPDLWILSGSPNNTNWDGITNEGLAPTAAKGVAAGNYWYFPGNGSEVFNYLTGGIYVDSTWNSASTDFYVVYTQEFGNPLFIVSASVSTGIFNAPSPAGPLVGPGGGGGGANVCIALESTGHCLVCYTDATSGFLSVVEYNIGASTWGIPVAITGAADDPLTMVIDENDTLHIFYQTSGGGVYYIQYSVVGGINTTVLTPIPPYLGGNLTYGLPSLITNSNKTLVMPYVASFGSTYGPSFIQIAPYTSSTPTISLHSPLSFGLNNLLGELNITSCSDGNICTIFWGQIRFTPNENRINFSTYDGIQTGFLNVLTAHDFYNFPPPFVAVPFSYASWIGAVPYQAGYLIVVSVYSSISGAPLYMFNYQPTAKAGGNYAYVARL